MLNYLDTANVSSENPTNKYHIVADWPPSGSNQCWCICLSKKAWRIRLFHLKCSRWLKCLCGVAHARGIQTMKSPKQRGTTSNFHALAYTVWGCSSLSLWVKMGHMLAVSGEDKGSLNNRNQRRCMYGVSLNSGQWRHTVGQQCGIRAASSCESCQHSASTFASQMLQIILKLHSGGIKWNVFSWK